LPFFNRFKSHPQFILRVALFLSIALHIGFIWIWIPAKDPYPKKLEDTVVVQLNDPKEIPKKIEPLESALAAQDLSIKNPATQAAPAAPTAEEWAFAAKYTLKNSKGYRHSWGQQVRSMMGTATEGADQGQVRFKIQIAPNGSIDKVDTLWKTSDVAEKLARQAIKTMPPLPPTPTGQPLIFEKTISFSPFADDAPPIYRDDCLPDPPAFNNPFAWDGTSPQEIKKNKTLETLSPEALAACLKQLPQDSIEAESAHDQRQLDQWGSSKLNQSK
jgi:TonB family protein